MTRGLGFWRRVMRITCILTRDSCSSWLSDERFAPTGDSTYFYMSRVDEDMCRPGAVLYCIKGYDVVFVYTT